MADTYSTHSHEAVHLIDEPALGLFGVIAIHSTLLGPAAGGCRVWRYPDREAVVEDALRLSRGMTYKNAMAGLPLGGGKAVLTIAEGADRTKALRAFGRAIEDLGGSYITAEDVGTSESDMRLVAQETRFVSGMPRTGHEAAGGDPSPWTALGVFLSIEAAVARRLGSTLSGVRVAVQGVGNVGGSLCRMLVDAGAKLVIADRDARRVRLLENVLGATPCSTDQIHAANADVFAPCALGSALNAETIDGLQAAIVCGAANNQLADDRFGEMLKARGVLYAPDYVVNAGGIISVSAEWLGESRASVDERVRRIPKRLADVLDRAEAERTPTHAAADSIVEEQLAAAQPVLA